MDNDAFARVLSVLGEWQDAFAQAGDEPARRDLAGKIEGGYEIIEALYGAELREYVRQAVAALASEAGERREVNLADTNER